MLARFALISGTVFLSCCLAAPEPFFSIRSKGTTGRVEVRYFLTGAFGGYGGFVRDAQKDGVYRIPLFVDRRTEQAGKSGTPAESLKAILYSTGCQFDLLSVDLNVTSNRTVNFGCRALPTIRLGGRILPLPRGLGPWLFWVLRRSGGAVQSSDGPARRCRAIPSRDPGFLQRCRYDSKNRRIPGCPGGFPFQRQPCANGGAPLANGGIKTLA